MIAVSNEDLFGDDPDRMELARIHAAAHERFGGGLRRLLLLDLGPRLDLVRAALRLQPSAWDDQTVGQIIFGGTEGRASARMSKIKNGTLRMDVGIASMLASLVNYILCVQPVCEQGVTLAQRRDVLEWTVDPAQQGRQTELLHARNIMGDLLGFAQSMITLAGLHRLSDGNTSTWIDAHNVVLEYLKSPIDYAARDQRLVIQRARQRQVEVSRFGTLQRPGAHPRHWEPVRLAAGDKVEMGVPRHARTPQRGWLVTVRDALNGASKVDDPWVWRQGWERTVRWSPAFTLAPEDDIAVPATSLGEVVAMGGRYQVFLFVEPQDSQEVTKLLRSPGDPTAMAPDETGYRRLINDLPRVVEKWGVKLYTGSYLVEA